MEEKASLYNSLPSWKLARREGLESEVILLPRCKMLNRGQESWPQQKRHPWPLLPVHANGAFLFPVFSQLRVCSMPSISLAKEGQDRVPQGRARSLGTSDSLTAHTEVLISKQTACRRAAGRCFFWLLWSKWNGQAVVRLASERAKGSWEVGVRLWMQVTANG